MMAMMMATITSVKTTMVKMKIITVTISLMRTTMMMVMMLVIMMMVVVILFLCLPIPRVEIVPVSTCKSDTRYVPTSLSKFTRKTRN